MWLEFSSLRGKLNRALPAGVRGRLWQLKVLNRLRRRPKRTPGSEGRIAGDGELVSLKIQFGQLLGNIIVVPYVFVADQERLHHTIEGSLSIFREVVQSSTYIGDRLIRDK